MIYLAPDANDELCLFQSHLDDQYPRCVQRQSDVDPITWRLVVGNLRVQIPRESA